MPATYTHAVFGQKVLMALDPALRERIEKHRDLYDIGLHGPDILFFYQCQDRVDVRQFIKFQKDVHIFGITHQVPFNIRQKTETDDN